MAGPGWRPISPPSTASVRITGYAVERVIADGEWVTVLARARAQVLATGAELEIAKVDVLRLCDGRIQVLRRALRHRRRAGRAAGHRRSPLSQAALISAMLPIEADGLPTPRRLWAVVAVSVSIAITVLDSSMLNVALPGIARTLGITPATATWLLNAYQLTVVTTLLPLASLGEKLGFRPVFLGGFALFGLASLGSAMAPGFEALLACRILQGLGSAAVMSLTAGMIRHIYPLKQLGRAIGINSMVVAIAGASAPSPGGGDPDRGALAGAVRGACAGQHPRASSSAGGRCRTIPAPAGASTGPARR